MAFSNFHESDKPDIRYVSALTEKRVEVHYKHREEDDLASPNLNIMWPASQPAGRGCVGYEALDLLQERVLYFDTDSVIFRSLSGEPKPQLGNYLGDFKNELAEDDYIVEFASGGPKNYGYQTFKGKQECKVRVIASNSEGSKQLNFPILRQNVLNDIDYPLETVARQTSKTAVLRPWAQTKKYQLVFSKRVVDPSSFNTCRYGYQAALIAQDLQNVSVLMDIC